MTVAPIDGLKAAPASGIAPERPAGPRIRRADNELSPMQQFEAFALRSFVESMLPSEATNFFGAGTAGNIWRSMMAEQLGNQLARGGGIGIADMISSDRGVAADAQGEIRSQQSQTARMRFDAVLAQTGKP
ncbi:rod-binding protein [Fulvimarina uroteuthidis]|uniref:rod-binding protein n=1 Tax=Fulvimarina uroteuthidis TaxID=3098149 RepID=UPI003A0FD1CA